MKMNQKGRRSVVCMGVLAVFFAIAVLAPSVLGAADKLRVSNCYIGGAILPLWMAKDAGFYEREGLDVEQIWIQGNPATAALIAGEIDLLYCIPHNTISAIAGGADLVFVASIYNRMQYRIVVAPGIDKMEQLRGKVVGVAPLHDVAPSADSVAQSSTLNGKGRFSMRRALARSRPRL